tara:strand:- start:9 stop:641 length:633 start_codon:yes stop_codon:yes gene_type:complete
MGAKHTFYLPNGYDSEDYPLYFKQTLTKDFKIGHFGLYNELRDHKILWQTLSELTNSIKEFKLDLKLFFAGEVHNDFMNNLKCYNLSEKIEYHSYINHSEAIHNMLKCDLLLVTQGKTKSVLGRIPAKVFEYLKARRPILAIGKKNSDLDKLLSNISYAYFIDYNNTNRLKDVILEIYNSRNVNYEFSDHISHFSRKNQAKQLAKEINCL